MATLVDTNRFAGTCYQGANWVRAGQSQGRGRQGWDRRVRSTPIKEVYPYALVPDFRMRLQNPIANEPRAHRTLD